MELERWLLEQFLRWEVKGRGWMTWPERVALEPPFQRFEGHSLPHIADDGVRPTIFSSFAKRLFGGKSAEDHETKQEESEAEPELEKVVGDKTVIAEYEL